MLSESDNATSLRLYLEKELQRLNTEISEATKKETNQQTRDKLKLVKESIENNKNKKIDKEMILQILKVQKLISEINNNV